MPQGGIVYVLTGGIFLTYGMGIGDRIRELRGPESRPDFGRRIGHKGYATIGRWERSETTPSVDDLIAIARTCNVTMSWLCEGLGPKERDDGHQCPVVSIPPEVFPPAVEDVAKWLTDLAGKQFSKRVTARVMKKPDAGWPPTESALISIEQLNSDGFALVRTLDELNTSDVAQWIVQYSKSHEPSRIAELVEQAGLVKKRAEWTSKEFRRQLKRLQDEYERCCLTHGSGELVDGYRIEVKPGALKFNKRGLRFDLMPDHLQQDKRLVNWKPDVDADACWDMAKAHHAATGVWPTWARPEHGRPEITVAKNGKPHDP